MMLSRLHYKLCRFMSKVVADMVIFCAFEASLLHQCVLLSDVSGLTILQRSGCFTTMQSRLAMHGAILANPCPRVIKWIAKHQQPRRFWVHASYFDNLYSWNLNDNFEECVQEFEFRDNFILWHGEQVLVYQSDTSSSPTCYHDWAYLTTHRLVRTRRLKFLGSWTAQRPLEIRFCDLAKIQLGRGRVEFSSLRLPPSEKVVFQAKWLDQQESLVLSLIQACIYEQRKSI